MEKVLGQREGKTPIATTTAHALRVDAVRTVPVDVDGATVGHRDRAAGIAGATHATQRHTERQFLVADSPQGLGFLGDTDRGSAHHAGSAVAATATDTLRQDAVRLAAVGNDTLGIIDGDCPAHTADATAAAHGERYAPDGRRTGTGQTRLPDTVDHRTGSTGTTATAEAHGKNAVGLSAQRDDAPQGITGCRQVRDRDGTASAAAAAATTHGQRQRVAALGAGHGADEHQFRIATLATDGLGKQADGAGLLRADTTGIRHDDLTARGTLPARATNENGRTRRRIGTGRADRVDGHATVAAATAETLRQYAMRTDAASDDDARVIDGDEATGHAGATITAQQHIDALVTRLCAAARHAAAITATAAEGLRQHADGIGAEGVYLGRRRHADLAAVAALATGPAHREFRTGRNACHVG